MMKEQKENMETVSSPLLTSWRFFVTIEVMVGTMLLMYFRMVPSITLVCMMPTWEHNEGEAVPSSNVTQEVPSEYDYFADNSSYVYLGNATEERVSGAHIFGWSKTYQGWLLSAFFYGLTIGMPMGGLLCNVFSSKVCLVNGVFWCSLSFFLIPYLAEHHSTLLIILRALQGLVSGIALPARLGIIGKWSTKKDMNILICIAYLGYSYGSLLSLYMSSFLCIYGPFGGWPSVYYCLAIMGVLYSIFVYNFLSETPLQHKFISPNELRYMALNNCSGVTNLSVKFSDIAEEEKKESLLIESDKESKVEFHDQIATESTDISQSTASKITPEDSSLQHDVKPLDLNWRSVFFYPPVIAAYYVNFCATYGFTTFGVNQPLFMRDLYNFEIEQNAYASSLPWLVHTPTCLLIPLFVKFLERYGDTTFVRKVITFIGMTLAAIVPLIVIELPYVNRWICSSLLTLVEVGNTLSFSGGYLCAFVDMAPQFAATLDGVADGFLGASGLLSPLITAYLTPTGSKEEWRLVFIVCFVIYISGIICFTIFGSSDNKRFNGTLVKKTKSKTGT